MKGEGEEEDVVDDLYTSKDKYGNEEIVVIEILLDEREEHFKDDDCMVKGEEIDSESDF